MTIARMLLRASSASQCALSPIPLVPPIPHHVDYSPLRVHAANAASISTNATVSVAQDSSAQENRARTKSVQDTLKLTLLHAVTRTSNLDSTEEEPSTSSLLSRSSPLLDEEGSYYRPPSTHDSLPEIAKSDPVALELVSTLHHAIADDDLNAAWEGYQTIVTTHPLGPRLLTPNQLHGLTSMLARDHPRTRQNFLRMLAVVSELRHMGQSVYQWEWNSLVTLAGSGFRKVRDEDFDAALGIVDELQHSAASAASAEREKAERRDANASFDDDRPHPPASDNRLSSNASPPPSSSILQPQSSTHARIDIVTVNALLSIASRTESASNVSRAFDVLNQQSPSLVPSRITHLTLMDYYARTNRPHEVPSVLRRMIEEGMDVGIDGLNIAMWAYARCAGEPNLRIAKEIYEVLRRNALPPEELGSPSINIDTDATKFPTNPVLSVPDITPHLSHRPSRVTYTLLIQALAYHGDLLSAVSIFKDMLVARPGSIDHSDRYKSDWELRMEEGGSKYGPSLEVYRAIFIGFAKHGFVEESDVHQALPEAELPAEPVPEPPAALPSSELSLVSRLASKQGIELPAQRRGFARPITLPYLYPRYHSSKSHSLKRVPEKKRSTNASMRRSPWTFTNLSAIFDNFLTLPIQDEPIDLNSDSDEPPEPPPPSHFAVNDPSDSNPSSTPSLDSPSSQRRPPIKPHLVWWILKSFSRTTNEDAVIMLDVWQRLKARFSLTLRDGRQSPSSPASALDFLDGNEGPWRIEGLQGASRRKAPKWVIRGQQLRTMLHRLEVGHVDLPKRAGMGSVDVKLRRSGRRI